MKEKIAANPIVRKVETMPTKKLYVVAGPTASGKTAFAIQLAQYFQTSIVSADSRQCYQEMTIGTAKPSIIELETVPHFFINSHSIFEEVNAAQYEDLALSHLENLFKEKEVVVVCGGTGLYIQALCEGLDTMPSINKSIETEVNKTYNEKGIQWLQEAVHQEDPLFYSQGEIHNPARLLRALIFKKSVGKSILHYRTGEKKQRNFEVHYFVLDLPREQLYQRINQRVDTMMQQGLLNEVQELYPYKHLKNLQTVGYSELFDFLEGKYSLPQAVEKIKQHTRNYAKRQITWFKRLPNAQFVSPDIAIESLLVS